MTGVRHKGLPIGVVLFYCVLQASKCSANLAEAGAPTAPEATLRPEAGTSNAIDGNAL